MRFNLLSIALQLFRWPAVSYIAGQIPLLESGVDHDQGQFYSVNVHSAISKDAPFQLTRVSFGFPQA